jgi:hypothetical protein
MAPAWVEDIAQAALPGIKFAGNLRCFYYRTREGEIDAPHKISSPENRRQALDGHSTSKIQLPPATATH